MTNVYYLPYSRDYLAHHGVKEQKWGVRRWQNKDGSLTPEGRIHYGYGEARSSIGTLNKASYASNKRLAKTLTKAINRDIRQRSWHDVSGDVNRYKNQKAVWDEINDKLKDTDEAKAADKAWNDRERYLKDHRGDTAVPLKTGYQEHEKAVADTQEAYHKKVLEVQDVFKDKIMSAKLKDLGQEDTEEARKVLDAILKDTGKLSVYSQLKNSREAKAALKELSSEKWIPLTAENSKSKYSDSDKSSMLDRAKSNDTWDLDFLESIQNTQMLHDGDTKAMLHQYEKYLNDPYKYMTEDSRKLKNM